MSQQTKVPPSELLTTAEPTPQLSPASVNRTEAPETRSTQSRKKVQIKTSIHNLKPKLSAPISRDSENAKIAANILTATLPALLAAGLVTKGTHKDSGNTVLVFPSTLWTEELRLR